MRQPIIFQQYYVLLLLAFAAVWSSGCEKDSIVHENLIIDKNTPPENNNVSTLQLNNYLNNIYILIYMVGRPPMVNWQLIVIFCGIMVLLKKHAVC